MILSPRRRAQIWKSSPRISEPKVRSSTHHIFTIVTLTLVRPAMAQFSPGDLSRPHAQLEGTQNCVKCHEVGKEISGAKCLSCHEEIARVVQARHGFHGSVPERKCRACHKEHLGRDVETMIFDRKVFDHATTGFALTGKHAAAACETCHQQSMMRDKFIRDLVERTGRKSFLGLDTSCRSCHDDRHAGTLGGECSTCHSTTSWTPAPGFDHSKTRFALAGKHMRVECSKCHVSFAGRSAATMTFMVKSFSDCNSCHASPHKDGFSGQACSSCHSTEGWYTIAGRAFNHDLTGFRLKGRHAKVKCEGCHRQGGTGTRSLRIAHERCTDCHEDYHGGVFMAGYTNDCERCHTENGFRPSTFTLAQHNTLEFTLTGAHGAIPCSGCHSAGSYGKPVFRFQSRTCEGCHRDVHGGQFADRMREQGCAACHTTSSWTSTTFDHSTTRFPLQGQHGKIPCGKCHTPRGRNGVMQFAGLRLECATCHRDPHAGQFKEGSLARCESCHATESWHALVFNHNTQSRFALTGAHSRLACRVCHVEETIAGAVVLRFKPLPTGCEGCHTGEGVRQ